MVVEPPNWNIYESQVGSFPQFSGYFGPKNPCFETMFFRGFEFPCIFSGQKPSKEVQLVQLFNCKMEPSQTKYLQKHKVTLPESREILGTPNNGSGMGIVWEAYHKGVPLLGVPENPIDWN